MEIEVNFNLPGVDAEGQEAPQVIDIDYPNIPPYPHSIESKTTNKVSFDVHDVP